MINTLLNGIFNLIISLINIIFAPIDALITTYMPTLSDVTTAIGDFINMCGAWAGWIISAFGIPKSLITFLIAYYTFKLTVPFLVHAVKLAIKWYDKLKP